MKTTALSPAALKTLPKAIWMGGKSISVYHGSPIEMVRQMADEMGEKTIRGAVETLLTALGRNRGLLIAIPEDAPDEILSACFVYALLQTGVSKPVAQS